MDKIPSLDGLRGISILAVLMGHGWGVSNYPQILKPLSWWADLGVHCFFVLSGYLITIVLIREYDKNRKISLKNFYAKRALRLLPAYTAFVIAIGLLHITPFKLSAQGWIGMVTFTNNVYPGSSTICHLWSLAVEQQFYLIWPYLFSIVALRSKYNLVKVSLTILLIPLLLCPISRAFQNPWPQAGWLGRYSFFNQADLLAYGCILAFISTTYTTALNSIISKNKWKWITLSILLITAPKALEMKDFFPYFFKSYRISLSGIGFSALIAWSIKYADTPTCRLLNRGLLPKIGIISYSIYIWHMIVWTKPDEFGFGDAPWSNFYIYFIMSLIIGYLSWLCFELPYFKKKKYPQNSTNLVNQD